MARHSCCLVVFLLVLQPSLSISKKDDSGKPESEKWKKKDVRDYTDADIERLYEQWEESDEDELEPDELPEWKREPPQVDMSKLDPSKPEEFLKMSKKGRTLMMFATVAGDPTESDTERISGLWHTSLFNANVETQRFVVGKNRVLFMCRDGSLAWDIKDFLMQQDNCDSIEIEGQTFHAKGHREGSNTTAKGKQNNSDRKVPASENNIKKKTKEEL